MAHTCSADGPEFCDYCRANAASDEIASLRAQLAIAVEALEEIRDVHCEESRCVCCKVDSDTANAALRAIKGEGGGKTT